MTMKPEILELMHAEIDGVATASQRDRLREALAGSAEIRDEYERLQGVTRLLAQLEPVAPPARLTAEVMRAVRARRPGSAGGWAQRLRALWPGGRVAIPYAYAAAAGAAIGVISFQLLITGGRGLGPDMFERDASATIGTLSGTPTGRTELTGPAAHGWASVRRLDDSLALDFDVDAPARVEVSVTFDSGSTQFIGISNRTGGADHIQVADGTIRWTQVRPERVTVLFNSRAARASRVEVGIAGERGAGGGTVELPPKP